MEGSIRFANTSGRPPVSDPHLHACYKDGCSLPSFLSTPFAPGAAWQGLDRTQAAALSAYQVELRVKWSVREARRGVAVGGSRTRRDLWQAVAGQEAFGHLLLVQGNH